MLDDAQTQQTLAVGVEDVFELVVFQLVRNGGRLLDLRMDVLGFVLLEAKLDCFVKGTGAKVTLKTVVKIDFRIDQISGLFESARSLKPLDQIVSDGL